MTKKSRNGIYIDAAHVVNVKDRTTERTTDLLEEE